MKKIISQNLQGKKVAFLFLLTGIVYSLMLMGTIKLLMRYSGGMEILDMMPTGYDAEYVHSLFTALGEKGRDFYLFRQIPLDLIYPLLYGISFCLVLAFLLKKIDKFDSPLYYFCLFPVVGALFDYCENFGIITLLNQYPEISNGTAALTNVFTLLKSGFTTVYFLVLTGVVINLGIRKFIK